MCWPAEHRCDHRLRTADRSALKEVSGAHQRCLGETGMRFGPEGLNPQLPPQLYAACRSPLMSLASGPGRRGDAKRCKPGDRPDIRSTPRTLAAGRREGTMMSSALRRLPLVQPFFLLSRHISRPSRATYRPSRWWSRPIGSRRASSGPAAPSRSSDARSSSAAIPARSSMPCARSRSRHHRDRRPGRRDGHPAARRQRRPDPGPGRRNSRQRGGASGEFDPAIIAPGLIDRVEVLRGPQSALYGSDAIGGVINIITRKGRGQPTYSIAIEGGSYGTLSAVGSMAGSTGPWSYAFSLSGARADGFSRYGYRIGRLEGANNIDGIAGGGLEADGYARIGGFGRIGYDPATASASTSA